MNFEARSEKMTPALSVRGARKAFAGAQALDGVDLEIAPAEIHALLGENGAGKSTLIKLLAGVYRADAGEFEIAGRRLPPRFSAHDVNVAGLRFVHQDFGLIDTLSVLENIALIAGFRKRGGLIDYRACAEEARKALDALALDISPETLVGELTHAEKAIVALARAMQDDARVIVLDEVTAALPSPDAARVHESVRAAKTRGIAFIYVSHRMEEVFDLCDRVTVLRDGRNVATADVAAIELNQVIQWIAGKSISKERLRASTTGSVSTVRLAADKLAGDGISTPISLTVHAAEIVGITGIIGSGYDRICEWLCGLAAAETGVVTIDGQALTQGSTRSFRDAGCEIVVGDRSQGAFPELTVRENLFADMIPHRDGRRGLASERKAAREAIERFDVRPRHAAEMQIQGLSGGNQQKVLFARALNLTPKVLVLIDPTTGVDVGARSELHRMLREAAESGTAVVLGSSDFEEIVAISDRVLVVRDGNIGAQLSGDAIQWDRLFSEAHGGHRREQPSQPGVHS